jgi:hypothetical protein
MQLTDRFLSHQRAAHQSDKLLPFSISWPFQGYGMRFPHHRKFRCSFSSEIGFLNRTDMTILAVPLFHK